MPRPPPYSLSAFILVVVLLCLATALPDKVHAQHTVRHAHLARTRRHTFEILPRLVPEATAAGKDPQQQRRRRRGAAKRAPVGPSQAELGWDDEWRVEVELPPAADDEVGGSRGETVVLHLAPTPDLLHPSASTRSSSSSSDARPLARESALAYSGFVLPLSLSDLHWSTALLAPAPSDDAADADGDDDGNRQRRRRATERPDGALGWARVVVDQAERGVFQGAFKVRGETWHVLPHKTFLLHDATSSSSSSSHLPSTALSPPLTMTRRGGDDVDEMPPPESETLVFYRDADVVAPLGPTAGCLADSLAFNVDRQHPIHLEGRRRTRVRPRGPWWVDGLPPPPASFGGGGRSGGGGGGGDLRSSALTAEGLFYEEVGSIQVGREEGADRSAAARVKRQDAGGSLGSNLDFVASIGQSAGCPTSQRVVYTGVAADCAYVRRYGGADEARQAILSNWNLASGVFRDTFNVSLGIVSLYVPSSTNSSCTSTPLDPSEAWNVDCSSLTLNDRLSEFSRWRGRSADWPAEAGLGHLLSGCPTGQEVGVAWLGLLCEQGVREQGSSGAVSGTAVSTFSPVEWQVVTHETGHNFGAVHDCASQTCVSASSGDGSCCPLSASTCDAGGQFIMSPVSQEGEEQFSPCSLGNVCSAFLQNVVDTSCLATPGGVTTISTQQCGNGIVEPGEDCDPGGRDSACCDPQTCRFRNGAVCDPASSVCCEASCTFSPSTTVCRPSVGECDLADMCTGSAATCPDDATVPDGTACTGGGGGGAGGGTNGTTGGGGGGGLECASGVCSSRDLQCQTVGRSLGITGACPSGLVSGESCTLTCSSPNNGFGCVRLQSSFIDGTSCGGGQGRCSNGRCSFNSGLARAKGWYLDNLRIAIPVTVVVGLIVLVILFFLLRAIKRCCTGGSGRSPKRTRHGGPVGAAANGTRGRGPQWGPGPMVSSNNSSGEPIIQHPPPGFVPHGQVPYQPQMQSPPPPWGAPPMPPSAGPPRGQWVDPSAYNGPNYRP